MNWVKGFALVTCLATPLSVIMAVSATAAPDATSKVTASGATASGATASGTQVAAVKVAAMTDAEKKAKLTDCSKQADAKKLHGEERRKFRATCIKG